MSSGVPGTHASRQAARGSSGWLHPARGVLWTAFAFLSVVACTPCEDDPGSGGTRTSGGGTGTDGVGDEPYVHPARRCGECHTRIVEQWRDSAHARASSSPLYRAMRQHSGRDDCARCHEPLADHLDSNHPARGEGVTCDACHTQSEVPTDRNHGNLSLRIYDNVRYGSVCDADDHYFHRVACAEAYSEARYCAGCHLLRTKTAGDESLLVYSEYEEWKKGPYADLDVPCQDCHMPERREPVAAGWEKEYDLSHHGFLGREGTLRSSALDIAVEVETDGERLELHATLRNSGAGHRVPTGLPGRRLLLTFRTIDEAGGELDVHRERFGRVLVDGTGEPVPYYEATRVQSDNRIGPRDERELDVTLDAPADGGTLRVTLAWEAIAPSIADRIGLDEAPEPKTLNESELRLEPSEDDHRPGLPATVRLSR